MNDVFTGDYVMNDVVVLLVTINWCHIKVIFDIRIKVWVKLNLSTSGGKQICEKEEQEVKLLNKAVPV